MKDVKLDKKEMEYLISLLSADDGKLSVILKKRLQKALTPIRAKSAKSKGRNLQMAVCTDISDLTGIPFDQQDDNCPIHSREMGLNGTDVILRGEAGRMFPFSIECKSCETLSVPQWIEQAKSNTTDNTDWLLIVKKQSVGSPFCVMDWKVFLKIYKKLLQKSS